MCHTILQFTTVTYLPEILNKLGVFELFVVTRKADTISGSKLWLTEYLSLLYTTNGTGIKILLKGKSLHVPCFKAMHVTHLLRWLRLVIEVV